MRKIGRGVFTWDGKERKTDRYGAFVLDCSTYSGDCVCEVDLDRRLLRALAGRRVRLIAVALEVRKSGHCGDLSHEIYPTTPEVGERVELGVGDLWVESVDWTPPATSIGLVPSDGRGVFWFDPRKFYRLHDQTVEVYAEETSDPPHAAPDMERAERGVTGVSDEEGTFQVKQIDLDREELQLLPKITRLGEGLFAVSGPEIRPGELVDFSVKKKEGV